MSLSTVLNKFNPLFFIEGENFKHLIAEKFNPFSRLTLVDNNLTSIVSLKGHNFKTVGFLDTFLENVSFDPFVINGTVSFGVFFLITSLFFKIGVAPFHAWLPEVYYKTPYPVMFLLITVIKLIFLLLLVYFFCNPFFFYFFAWRNYIFICIILCFFVGVLGAIGQKNIKKFFAYSSIVHSGYILLGLVCFNSLGVQSCLLYIFIYMITLGFLFYVLGAFNNKPFDKESVEKSGRISNINDLRRLRGSYPFISFLLTIVLLSMAGLPPFIGFFGKYYVLYAFYSSYHDFMFVGHNLIFSLEFFVFLLSVVTSVISSGYYLRLIKVMHFDKSDTSVFSYAFKVNYTNKFKDILFMFFVTLAFLIFIVLFIFYFRNFVGSISSYSVGLFASKFLTLWNFDGWLFGKISSLHYIVNESVFNQYNTIFTSNIKPSTFQQFIFTQLGISFEDFFYDLANKSFSGDSSINNSSSVLGLRNVETINIQLEDGLFLSWTASGLGYIEFEQAFFQNATDEVLGAKYKYYVNRYVSPIFSEFSNFYSIFKDVLDNSLFSAINNVIKFSGLHELIDHISPNPYKNSFEKNGDNSVFLFQESIGPLDATFGRDPLYDSQDGRPSVFGLTRTLKSSSKLYDPDPFFFYSKKGPGVIDEGFELEDLLEENLSKAQEDESLAFSDVQALVKYNLFQNAVFRNNYFITMDNNSTKFDQNIFSSLLPFLRYKELVTNSVYSPLENNIKLQQGSNTIQNQQFVSEFKKILWLFDNFAGKTPRLKNVEFKNSILTEPYQNRYFTLAKLNSKKVKTFILSDNLTVHPLKTLEDSLIYNVPRYFLPENVNAYIFNNYISGHFMKYLTFQSYLYESNRYMRYLMLKFAVLNINDETISPIFFNRASSFKNLKALGLPFCAESAFEFYVNSFIKDFREQSFSHLDKMLLPYYFGSVLNIYYGELNLNILSDFEAFPYSIRKFIMNFCNSFLYDNSSFCVTILKESLFNDSTLLCNNFKEVIKKPTNLVFFGAYDYLHSLLHNLFLYFVNSLANLDLGFSNFVPFFLSKLKTVKLSILYILYNICNIVNFIFLLNEFFALVFLILYNIFTILFLNDLSKIQLFYDLFVGFFVFIFSFFHTVYEANDFYLNFYNNTAIDDKMALIDYFRLVNDKFGPIFANYFKLAKFVISPHKVDNTLCVNNPEGIFNLVQFPSDLVKSLEKFIKPLVDTDMAITNLPYYPEFLNFAEYFNFDAMMTEEFDPTFYPLDNAEVGDYFMGSKPLNYGFEYMWDEDDRADLSFLHQDTIFPTNLANLSMDFAMIDKNFIQNLNLSEVSQSSIFGGFTSSWHDSLDSVKGLDDSDGNVVNTAPDVFPDFVQKRYYVNFNHYFVKKPIWQDDSFDFGGHSFIGSYSEFFADDEGDEDPESSYFSEKLMFSAANQLMADDAAFSIESVAGIHDEDNSFSFVLFPVGDTKVAFDMNLFTGDPEFNSAKFAVLTDLWCDESYFRGQDEMNLTKSLVTPLNSSGIDFNTDFTEGPYVDEMYGLINRWNPRDIFINKALAHFTPLDDMVFDLPSYYGVYGTVLNFQTLVADYYSGYNFSSRSNLQVDIKTPQAFLKKSPVNFSFLIDLVRNDGRIYEFLLFKDYNYSKLPGMISLYNLLNNMVYQSFNFLTYAFSLNFGFLPRGYLRSLFSDDFNIFSILSYFGVLFSNYLDNSVDMKLKYFSKFLDMFNYYFENIYRQYRIADTIFRYGMLSPLLLPSFYQFNNPAIDTEWPALYNSMDELDLIGLMDYEPADKTLRIHKNFVDERKQPEKFFSKHLKYDLFEQGNIFERTLNNFPFIHELVKALPYGSDISHRPLFTEGEATRARFKVKKSIKKHFMSIGSYSNDRKMYNSTKHSRRKYSTAMPMIFGRMRFENNFYNFGLNGYLAKITRENSYLLDLDFAYRATERIQKVSGNQRRPMGLDFPYRDLSIYRIFGFLLHYFFNAELIFGESGLLDRQQLMSSDFFVKALHKLPKVFIHFLNFEDMGSSFLLHYFLKEHQFRFKTSFLLFQDSSVNVLQPMLFFMKLYTSRWDMPKFVTNRTLHYHLGDEAKLALTDSPPAEYKKSRFILEESEFWDIYHNTDPFQDFYFRAHIPLGMPRYSKEDGFSIPLRSKLELGTQPENRFMFDNSPKGVIYFFRNLAETFSLVEFLYSLIYLIFVPFLFFKIFSGFSQALFFSIVLHKVFCFLLLLLIYVKLIPLEFADVITNIYILDYFNYSVFIDFSLLVYDYFSTFFERMFQADLDRLVNFGDEAFFYIYSNLFFMSRNFYGDYFFDIRFSYRFNKLRFIMDYEPSLLNFFNRSDSLSNAWQTDPLYRKQAEFFLNFFNMLLAFSKFSSLEHPYTDSFTSVPSLLDWGYFYTPNGYYAKSMAKKHSKSPNSHVLYHESLNSDYFNVEDYISRHLRNRTFHDLMFYTTGNINRNFSILYNTEMYTNYVRKDIMHKYPIFTSLLPNNLGQSLFSTGNLAPLYLNTAKSNITFFFYLFFIVSFLIYFKGLFKVYLFALFFHFFRNNFGVKAFGIFFYTLNIWTLVRFILNLIIEVIFLIILIIVQFLLKLFTSRDFAFVTIEDDLTNSTTESAGAGGSGLDEAISNNRFVLYHGPSREADDVVIEGDLYELSPGFVENSQDGFYVYSQESPYPMSDFMNLPLKKTKKGGAFFANYRDQRYRSLHFTFMYQHTVLSMEFEQTSPERWDLHEHRPMGLSRSYYFGSDIPVPKFNNIFAKNTSKFNYPFVRNRFFYSSFLNIFLRFLKYFISSMRTYQFNYLTNGLFFDNISFRENFNLKLIVINFSNNNRFLNRLKLTITGFLSKLRAFLRSLGT